LRTEATNNKILKNELEKLKKTHSRELEALKVELEREKDKSEQIRKKFEFERAKNISTEDQMEALQQKNYDLKDTINRMKH
jgi:hypothetical protein